MIQRFFAALFAIALVCRGPLAAAPAMVPEKFGAFIGGFLGSTYLVELRDGALHYTEKKVRNGRFQVTESATVTPTVQQWEEFRKNIDELNLWQWRADYPSQGIVDGTQWSLEIAYADHVLKTNGSNNYPDASGNPSGNSNVTKTFGRYLAAIKRLIGGRSFE
jgi:hypothetical protein